MIKEASGGYGGGYGDGVHPLFEAENPGSYRQLEAADAKVSETLKKSAVKSAIFVSKGAKRTIRLVDVDDELGHPDQQFVRLVINPSVPRLVQVD